MKNLIDESVDFALLESCRQAGFEVLCIAHFAQGCTDANIITLSGQMQCTILTEDKDFVEIVFKIRCNLLQLFLSVTQKMNCLICRLNYLPF